MISEDSFNKLNNNNKLETIFNYGEELMIRNYNNFYIKLYSISNFYVEVWYDSENNKIEKIDCLNSENIFDYYGNEIDISGLFNKP